MTTNPMLVAVLPELLQQHDVSLGLIRTATHTSQEWRMKKKGEIFFFF